MYNCSDRYQTVSVCLAETEDSKGVLDHGKLL